MYTREEILDESRRTTKGNGGKPLGRKSFSNETGIGSYDWGQYWAKYGDLVIEAGSTPNLPYKKYPEGCYKKYYCHDYNY